MTNLMKLSRYLAAPVVVVGGNPVSGDCVGHPTGTGGSARWDASHDMIELIHGTTQDGFGGGHHLVADDSIGSTRHGLGGIVCKVDGKDAVGYAGPHGRLEDELSVGASVILTLEVDGIGGTDTKDIRGKGFLGEVLGVRSIGVQTTKDEDRPNADGGQSTPPIAVAVSRSVGGISGQDLGFLAMGQNKVIPVGTTSGHLDLGPAGLLLEALAILHGKVGRDVVEQQDLGG